MNFSPPKKKNLFSQPIAVIWKTFKKETKRIVGEYHILCDVKYLTCKF